MGPKKAAQEPTAVIDPQTGMFVLDPTKIKEVVLEFCKKLLTNREPSEGYESDLELKRSLHNVRMEEIIEEDIGHVSLEMFNKTVEELWKKKKEKYKFIINAGFDLKDVLFQLFNSVWESEIIPKSWQKTTLIQIFKGKGNFQDLSCMRNLHLKEEIPKMWGHILVSQVKEKLMSNMTIFQIGAKSGHRAAEHIYVMKSVMQNMNT